MNKKHLYFIAISSFLLSFLMIFFYHILFSTKIKYVQTDKLVYGYEGMKEYQKIYEEKKLQLKSNIDSLDKDFRIAVEAYQKSYSSISISERKQKEQLLQRQEENLLKYREAAENQMHKEDSEMTSKALEQISIFVQTYGKEKGYALILGTTDAGGILYGTPQEDITEKLLEELNLHYKGKKQ